MEALGYCVFGFAVIKLIFMYVAALTKGWETDENIRVQLSKWIDVLRSIPLHEIVHRLLFKIRTTFEQWYPTRRSQFILMLKWSGLVFVLTFITAEFSSLFHNKDFFDFSGILDVELLLSSLCIAIIAVIMSILSFSKVKIMASWSDRQKDASAFISANLFDDMLPNIMNWLKSDDERTRYNAYVLIRDAKKLELIDVKVFHHETLKTFDAHWGAPDNFDEALLYFKTTKDPEGARVILLACKKRVNDYIKRVTAEGHPDYAQYSRTNIEELDKLLNKL